MEIAIKSVRVPRETTDGFRVLAEGPVAAPPPGVDHDMWIPELAPRRALTAWYGGDHGRWEEYRIEYLAELQGNPFLQRIVEAADGGRLTLLTMSADLERSPAAVLAGVLRGR